MKLFTFTAPNFREIIRIKMMKIAIKSTQNPTILKFEFPDFITQNESNLRFIKLYSPINSILSWQGNKFIDKASTKLYGDWDCRYIELFQSKTILSIRYDSTITVSQYLDTNAIEKTHFFKTYTPRVGLIYAEYHKIGKKKCTE